MGKSRSAIKKRRLQKKQKALVKKCSKVSKIEVTVVKQTFTDTFHIGLDIYNYKGELKSKKRETKADKVKVFEKTLTKKVKGKPVTYKASFKEVKCTLNVTPEDYEKHIKRSKSSSKSKRKNKSK